MYSLSTLSILMLAIRTYYSNFSELKPMLIINDYEHEILISIFGVISTAMMLFERKRIKTKKEILGSFIFMVGLYILHLTHKEMNESFSPRLDIDPNRKLITTGIFKIIRHPMYLSANFLNVGIWLMAKNNPFLRYSYTIFCLLLICRIPAEENFLKQQFPIYNNVMPNFKIIPFIY